MFWLNIFYTGLYLSKVQNRYPFWKDAYCWSSESSEQNSFDFEVDALGWSSESSEQDSFNFDGFGQLDLSLVMRFSTNSFVGGGSLGAIVGAILLGSSSSYTLFLLSGLSLWSWQYASNICNIKLGM